MERLPLSLSALLDVRIRDDDRHDKDENHDDRMREPAEAIAGHRNEQVSFDDFAENETQDKRRARPTEQHHEITEDAEAQGHHQIDDLAIGRIAADKYQQQDKRND